MTEHFLNGAYVVTIMKQMGSETVVQLMHGYRFSDACLLNGLFSAHAEFDAHIGDGSAQFPSEHP